MIKITDKRTAIAGVNSHTKYPAMKMIDDFDSLFQSSVNKRTLNDYITCQFIRNKANIIFVGNPSTGKAHLAIGIPLKVLLKGYKV